MDETMARVTESPYGKDETIQKSLARYKQFVAEYHQAKSTSGAPAVVPATDIPPGAPPGTPAAEPLEE
jgi:hypothetical protein